MIGDNTIRSYGLIDYGNFYIKAYLFEDNFEKAFGPNDVEALEEISHCISANPNLRISPTGRNYKYAIAFPYSLNGKDRMVDYYGFDFDCEFEKCNPEWKCYVLENGAFKEGLDGCGTGLIILGKEEELRRETVEEGRSMNNYVFEFANLKKLGPVNLRRSFLKLK